MPKLVELFYDVGSPYSYLACTQAARFRAQTGCELRLRAFLLGGVFKATDNHMPALNPTKARWMIGDLERWAERYGVPFRMSPHFSFNTLRMQRTLIAAEQRDPSLAERAALALYRRLWGEEADPVDPATTHAALLEAGASDADAAALLSAPDEPAIKQALLQATEEAVRRGAFGAPAIFVGDELHWGNDRLDLLAWRLATGRIPA